MRSPYEKAAGCYWLPRLIDKLRMRNTGTLPTAYVNQLLSPQSMDNLFLQHFQINDTAAFALRVVTTTSDAQVSDWLEARSNFCRATIKSWNQYASKFGTSGKERLFLQQTIEEHYPTAPKNISSLFDLLVWDETYNPLS